MLTCDLLLFAAFLHNLQTTSVLQRTQQAVTIEILPEWHKQVPLIDVYMRDSVSHASIVWHISAKAGDLLLSSYPAQFAFRRI